MTPERPKSWIGCRLSLERRGAAIAKWLIALADCLAEAVLHSLTLEFIALGCVAGDAVQQRPKRLCRMQALGVKGLVDETAYYSGKGVVVERGLSDTQRH